MSNLVAFVGSSDSPYRHWLSKLLSERGLKCIYYKTFREFRDANPELNIEFMVCVTNGSAADHPSSDQSSRRCEWQSCSMKDCSFKIGDKASRPAASIAGARAPAPRNHFSRLTRRELQTLQLVAAGWSSKQIAHELGIALRTVANHRASIRGKTGFTSIAQLVSAYLQSTGSP